MAKAAPASPYREQRRQIDTDIKTETFRTLYLITGTESYLRLQVKRNLMNALAKGAGEMNLMKVRGEKLDPQEIVNFASTTPFFADRRVVLAEETGFFKKGCELLSDWLAEEAPRTATLVFVESQVDKRTALYKAAQKRGREISCDPQSPKDIRLWVASRFKGGGHTFTERTLDHFLSGIGGDMAHIEQEIHKILSYTEGKEEITAKDVDRISTGITEARIFDLTDALAERDADKALQQYVRMLEVQEEPNRILSLITKQFHQLLQVKELEKRHAGDEQIALAAGISPRIVFRYVRWIRKFSLQELREALDICLTNEQAMKRGRLDKTIAVEMVITEITRKQAGGSRIA
ncbi:MAG: DNA polymerase III subunit delta [Lachnospiraceae bacterium]|nr:DNA polymerase III subunit delta [Lachnospiraceae bacterium]